MVTLQQRLGGERQVSGRSSQDSNYLIGVISVGTMGDERYARARYILGYNYPIL